MFKYLMNTFSFVLYLTSIQFYLKNLYRIYLKTQKEQIHISNQTLVENKNDLYLGKRVWSIERLHSLQKLEKYYLHFFKLCTP